MGATKALEWRTTLPRKGSRKCTGLGVTSDYQGSPVAKSKAVELEMAIIQPPGYY